MNVCDCWFVGFRLFRFCFCFFVLLFFVVVFVVVVVFCLIVCLPISPSPIVLMASVDVKLHRTVAPSPSFYASLILSIDGVMTLPLARKWRLKFFNLWDLACQRSFGTCTKTT